jgi:PAS domain S-box-containing protein
MLDGLAEKNRQLGLLAGITATSPLPIMLVDENMKIRVWNEAAERLFGWSRAEILGLSPFDTVVPVEEQEKVRRVRADTTQSAAARYETVRLSKNGVRIPVENISTRLRDPDGRFTGNIVIYRDLREIRKLQESVLQTEKMGAVGQLAAGVAHEINNPLGIILGFAQSLVKRLKEDDPLALPLKSIEREALRCKSLVQDLLVFSRSSKIESEHLDLNEALVGALSLIFARARTQGVEIVQQLSPELPRILANRNKLQQVLINLANNAIDAMPKGGTLTIATALGGDRPGHVEIGVSDTGHGIPGEIRARIMEPFFTTKEAGKGTGLGLSLVYEIVKNHRGTVEVESEEGKGSKFTIRLPLPEVKT